MSLDQNDTSFSLGHFEYEFRHKKIECITMLKNCEKQNNITIRKNIIIQFYNKEQTALCLL